MNERMNYQINDWKREWSELWNDGWTLELNWTKLTNLKDIWVNQWIHESWSKGNEMGQMNHLPNEYISEWMNDPPVEWIFFSEYMDGLMNEWVRWTNGWWRDRRMNKPINGKIAYWKNEWSNE